MEDMYRYDIRQFYIMLAMMKLEFSVLDLDKVLEMDALTIYNYILLNVKKECYKANGMKDE